ncbi:O-antigen ligase family protein [Macrococcoides canis]|uniref:O-antigen ligase family protein n=1 Tax=Macrococcoides canis TaxID=1855823 RepID=UPI00207C755E|nr:O-antigen ligase family protein [Macrococcus canis]MCO4096704.1 O-antigen ligase family protein [Macrococcus canis]UTH10028.1 O-antigen ligase family protein [Macrococcus canis]
MAIKSKDFLILLIIMMCITPLTLPNFFFRIPLIETLVTLINLLILVVFALLNLLSIKRINYLIVFSIVFFSWRYYSSHYLAGGITDLNNIISTIALILVVNYFTGKNLKCLLNAMFIIFSIFIILNFLTQFLFPNGLYLDIPRINQYRPAWVFGIDNAFLYYILPMITVIIFRSIIIRNRLTVFTVLMMSISIVSIFLAHSATAIVTLLGLYIVIICYRFTFVNKFLNFVSLSIMYIIIWFFVIRVSSFEFFEYFIVDLLGKDLTFSGRTKIWNIAFEVINANPWYGYGIGYAFRVSYTYFVAHNQLLQLTIENGIIGLLLFGVLLFIVGYKLQVYRGYIESLILSIGIFMFFFAGLTEAYQYKYVFILFTFAYSIKKIIINKEVSTNE